jgi:tetratricopeptide (TPR) repeat protein
MVQPLLCGKDVGALCSTLQENWTEKQIMCLLKGSHADARKVAALALGLLGDKSCIEALAEQLADPDPIVNQMAEHALWSIWFRCGSDCANHRIKKGLDALHHREFDEAVREFSRAIELAPDFAEAYNQRAIAHYLKEEYEESAQDCRATVKLMKFHFGAWAGLGHCYAHLNRLPEAIECYEQALEINPHLTCVRDAVLELRAATN